MKMFTKRLEVEAVQWRGDNALAFEVFHDLNVWFAVDRNRKDQLRFDVATPIQHATFWLSKGDWLIREPDGRLVVVKMFDVDRYYEEVSR